jgi:COP9 signalosome complex subunit 1
LVITGLYINVHQFIVLDRKYKSAAKQFLEANLDYCDCPDLMSAHNVAVYGGLTALATFDRADLIKLVLSNSQFKVYFNFYDFIL